MTWSSGSAALPFTDLDLRSGVVFVALALVLEPNGARSLPKVGIEKIPVLSICSANDFEDSALESLS